MMGFVSIVGAGPGHPDLLTLRAARRLGEADLVLYDALVSPELLRLAPRAQCFFVGKRARRKAMAQETIHHLMIRAAKKGKRVVRLKCGDPFVFGRGGEEGLALASAGVPFEIVPGVTSAVAAPELAGIPLTHRGMASAFVVVSGHAEAAYAPILDTLAPQSLTLVVLMGMASRKAISHRLLERGWDPQTPSAILLAAATPAAYTWTGRLIDLEHARIPPELSDAAGTLAIGKVVSLSPTLTMEAPALALEAEARS